jgi:hypothetical protein
VNYLALIVEIITIRGEGGLIYKWLLLLGLFIF